MKIQLKNEKEFDAKYLKVNAKVRYWEDATIDGVEDTDGDLTPCSEGDYWKPLIDIDNGKILNWTKGVTASIHFKVCDCGVYTLLEENRDEIIEIDGYVPCIMSPKENGYGDYIIMDINQHGDIEDWDVDLEDFKEED